MSLETCAACGKANEGLKACKACKLVKYCGRECQIAHRPHHKKACKKKVAELFEQKLYEQPQRNEDCPICMLLLPLSNECAYKPCCGKMICMACHVSLTRDCCPFCNTPRHQSEDEAKKRLLKRIEQYNDPEAMIILASYYNIGKEGFRADHLKAAELLHRAVELGSAGAHFNLGQMYSLGRGVELDKKKAVHHYQMAAILGSEVARYHLGTIVGNEGNDKLAMRHFMISAKSGHDDSLDYVKKGYVNGMVTKNEFESTLRGHQASRDETKSEQRDRAKLLYKGFDPFKRYEGHSLT